MPHARHLKRLAAMLAAAGGLSAVALVPASSGSLQSEINSKSSVASTLQSQINADSAKISQTANGVAAARSRLAEIQTRLDIHIAQLRRVQTELMQARDHLTELESRLKVASGDLSINLRATYENGDPNLIDAVLNAGGFAQLLDQVNFVQRISKQDAQIVGYTRAARKQVLAETIRLGTLEESDRNLTDQILSQRNQVAALQSALLTQEIDATRARANAKGQLSTVNSQLSSLRAKLAAEEARAAAEAEQTGAQVNQSVGGIAIDTGGMVQPPAGAPEAVKEMIAAGNAIATLPYIWGGGHASFISPGYDCSGSVSYVLAAAGLLSSPLDSAGFASYGDPGPGQWVTIYVDPGVHVWMEIAGWRFDTVALAEDGSRWSQGGGEFAGFEVRHPPGL